MKYLLLVSILISNVLVPDSDNIGLEKCEIDIAKGININCGYGNDYALDVKCNCKVKNYRLFLFDRFGNILYESNDINDDEDFRYLENGTYETGEEFVYKDFIYALTPGRSSY